MLYKFRHQRGTLKESLSTTKIFRSEEDLKNYVAQTCNFNYDGEEVVKFTPNMVSINNTIVIDDDRIGWKNCRQVLLDVGGEKCAVGFVSITDDNL